MDYWVVVVDSDSAPVADDGGRMTGSDLMQSRKRHGAKTVSTSRVLCALGCAQRPGGVS